MKSSHGQSGARALVLMFLAAIAPGTAYSQAPATPTVSIAQQDVLTSATVSVDGSGLAIGGPAGGAEAAPGRVIVRFRAGVSFLPGSGRNVPLVPAVLGLVLGPLSEQQFRRALAISEGDATVFLTRPICATLLVLAALILLGPRLLRRWAAPDARPVV